MDGSSSRWKASAQLHSNRNIRFALSGVPSGVPLSINHVRTESAPRSTKNLCKVQLQRRFHQRLGSYNCSLCRGLLCKTTQRNVHAGAADRDGDLVMLPFTPKVVCVPGQVTDAPVVESRPVEFAVRLSRGASRYITLHWTVGMGGEDYTPVAAGQVRLEAGETSVVRTLDDRRMDPPATVALPADALIEVAAAEERIKGDDTEQARKRSLGTVLAWVGRPLAMDAVEVIGERFERSPADVGHVDVAPARSVRPYTVPDRLGHAGHPRHTSGK